MRRRIIAVLAALGVMASMAVSAGATEHMSACEPGEGDIHDPSGVVTFVCEYERE